MTDVQFPRMREYVLDALMSLADREYQAREWGVYKKEENRYDDLTLNVHILYDDCEVLPDPASRVGSVLLPGDIQPLLRLDRALDPLIRELGDRPDSDYLSDPRWNEVLEAACAAVAVFENSGPTKVP